jgi:REP element-mobilizing transposase RayT
MERRFGPGHPPRLCGWDYSSTAWYFVTFCTYRRRRCLSIQAEDRIYLTPHGLLVRSVWRKLPIRFRGLRLGPMVVMPAHVHALLRLGGRPGGWCECSRPVGFRPGMAEPDMVLGKVIRSWKAGATWRIRYLEDWSFRWQSRYYDSIVRDRADLIRVADYIRNHSPHH